MYIFEIIAKLLLEKRARKYNSQEPDIENDSCEHIYLAIDSTKDYLACNKCGHVIKNQKKTENKNFFNI